jgi:hypothetical protein
MMRLSRGLLRFYQHPTLRLGPGRRTLEFSRHFVLQKLNIFLPADLDGTIFAQP